jgi:Lipase (class 3)
MIPSDADLASLNGAIYAYAGAPVVAWDHYDDGKDDGVCWALKRLDGYDVAVMRGSDSPWDWIKDFTAVPIKTAVGTVHAGFHFGTDKVASEIRALARQPIIVTGHSLGAAEASNVTAYLIINGAPPVKRVAFGEPRPGFDDHAAIVAKAPGFSYCNGLGSHVDMVTEVPFRLPNFPFGRGSPLIAVSDPPPPNDEWGVFSFHHIQLYMVATAAASKGIAT